MEWLNVNIANEWQVVFMVIGLFFLTIGLFFLLMPEWLVTLSAWSNRILFLDYIPMTHRGKSAVVLFMTSLLMFWLALQWHTIMLVLLGLFFSATGLCFLLAPEWLVTLSAWSNRVLFLDYIPMIHRGKSAVVLFMTSLLMFWLALQWH